MTTFDMEAALKGYALNKLCFSLNQADNRAAFLADEDAYCVRYGLNEEERAAVKSRDKKALKAVGGNQYFLAKLERTIRSLSGASWKEPPSSAGAQAGS